MMKSTKEEQAMDVMLVASNVYETLMENDRVRVLKVVFKPGDKAAMHHHPDHAVYVIKGGKLRFSYPDKNDESMELESGNAIFLDAQNHEATNIGDSNVELVVVELK